VLNVPEQFYLAVLYHRAGYQFLDRRHEQEVSAVARAARKLRPPLAAWAAERGCVRLLEGQPDNGAQAWTYSPAELVAPISRRLEARLSHPPRLIKQLVRSRLRAEIDLERLRQSPRVDLVEGLNRRRLARSSHLSSLKAPQPVCSRQPSGVRRWEGHGPDSQQR
jgi:hypothetical protein